MSATISRTSTVAQQAYAAWRPRAQGARAARAGGGETVENPGERSQRGYLGLQEVLAATREGNGTRSAALLAAMIHSMGGAATSVARGLYLNTLI